MMRFTVIVLLLGAALSAARAEDRPAQAGAKPESIQALIRQLGHEEFQEREKAEQELLKTGMPAVPILRKELAGTLDAETRTRVQRLLEALTAPLALTVAFEGEAKAGRPLKLKLRIKNISEKEQVVVGCLDGSARLRRFPHFNRTVSPAEPDSGGRGFCGNCNMLKASDLVTLKPGEEFDPCGPDSFGRELTEWTPTKAGKFTLTFACSYSAKELSHWNGPVERSAGLGGLEATLGKVPKVTLTAKLDVTVEP